MPRLDKLPNELQGLVISKLNTKSKSKLRTVSKEMRRAVDDVEPPTGSYERKTGRFQSFWTKKKRRRCHYKHGIITTDHYSKHGYGHAPVNGMVGLVFDECMKEYKGSTLLGVLRVMRTETPDEFAHFFLQYYQGDPYTEHAWNILNQNLREQKEYLRRVTRLIKQWGKRDKRYAQTYHLIMKRTELYTPYEERMHKDRIMDALLIQYIGAIVSIDPTKPGYTATGKKRDLSEQVKYVTGLCREKTRDNGRPGGKTSNF